MSYPKLPVAIELTFAPGRIANPAYFIRREVERQYNWADVQVQEDYSFYFNDWPYYFSREDQKKLDKLTDGAIVHQEVKIQALKLV